MALFLPKPYQKEALCKAHNSIFGSHNATLKTYIKITSSNFWPRIYQNPKRHVQTGLTCQQQKQALVKPTPLAPLLIPEQPNWRIQTDLFGPKLTADSKKKFCYASPTNSQNRLPSL
jgi:hypothetical protein